MVNSFYVGNMMLLFCAFVECVSPEELSCGAHDLQALMIRLRQLKTETENKFKKMAERIEFLEKEIAGRNDGEWSIWGDWGSCTDSCGGGIQARNRTCSDPAPSKFGKPCLGNSELISLCNKQRCPESDMNIAFTATNSHSNIHGVPGLKFTSVLLNLGRSYDSTYGTFTTPTPGLYHFVVVLTMNDTASYHHKINCYLCLNAVHQFSLFMRRRDDDYSTTVAGTFDLKRNDTVNVCSCTCTSTQYINKDTTTMFSGFLIKPGL